MRFTVHWLNLSSLERNSKALACRRMLGRYTYDAIANCKFDAIVKSFKYDICLF